MHAQWRFYFVCYKLIPQSNYELCEGFHILCSESPSNHLHRMALLGPSVLRDGGKLSSIHFHRAMHDFMHFDHVLSQLFFPKINSPKYASFLLKMLRLLIIWALSSALFPALLYPFCKNGNQNCTQYSRVGYTLYIGKLQLI